MDEGGVGNPARMAVDQQLTPGRPELSRDQLEDGALAAPGLTDDGILPPPLEAHGEVAGYGLARTVTGGRAAHIPPIGEVHVSQLDGMAHHT